MTKNSKMNEKPYRKMKDRDMHDVKVYFEIYGAVNPCYRLKDIVQPDDKITTTYIANLAGTTATREWCDKSMGGWIYYVPFLNKQQYFTMCQEINRLGGTVILDENRRK